MKKDKKRTNDSERSEYITEVKMLNEELNILYNRMTTLGTHFEAIENIPSLGENTELSYKHLKETWLEWKRQINNIESNYIQPFEQKQTSSTVPLFALDIGKFGVDVAMFGPESIMCFIALFGKASTGTPIRKLNGAACINAIKACIGGGSLSKGGKGVKGGDKALDLVRNAGFLIAAFAGAAFLGWAVHEKSYFRQKYYEIRLKNILPQLKEREAKRNKSIVAEVNTRIVQIKHANQKIALATENIKSFGSNYNFMTELQQHELKGCIGLLTTSTRLLTDPISTVLPRYNESDLNDYLISNDKSFSDKEKRLIVFLANFLYGVETTDDEKHLIWNFFKNNKNFRKKFDIAKKAFTYQIIETTCDAIKGKQS